MRIILKPSEPLCFAGLWYTWKAPEGEIVHSSTIITTAQNEVMESIHNRMSVILPREAEHLWLDPRQSEPTDSRPCSLRTQPQRWTSIPCPT